MMQLFEACLLLILAIHELHIAESNSQSCVNLFLFLFLVSHYFFHSLCAAGVTDDAALEA